MIARRFPALSLILAVVAAGLTARGLAGQDRPLRVFISVDMEGIGGIGTGKMTNGTGKDYATGRSLMTAEVNTVVEAIYEHGPAEILVNDSHGDMQNLLHTRAWIRVSPTSRATSSHWVWCKDSMGRSTPPSSSAITPGRAPTAASWPTRNPDRSKGSG